MKENLKLCPAYNHKVAWFRVLGLGFRGLGLGFWV